MPLINRRPRVVTPPEDVLVADKPAFTLRPRQAEIIRKFGIANARHNLIYGGARSGKTFLLTRATAIRTLAVPIARSVIIRRHLQHVKESVWMDTLPKVLRTCWPGLKPIMNNSDMFMIFPNSKVPKEDWSELWIAGLDDKDRTEKILGKEFCVDPDAKVLTANLKWSPAKSIIVGQEIIGFPEDLEGHQKLVRSTVLANNVVRTRRFKITTTRGTTIVSTNHRFVQYKDDRRTKNFRCFSWVNANALKIGDCIRYACAPWEEDNSYDSSWLAGIYDGEGWIGKSRACCIAQNEGPVLNRIRSLLLERNISVNEYRLQNKRYPDSNCIQLKPTNMWDSLRILGMTRPTRLFQQHIKVWEDCRGFIVNGEASGYGTGRPPDENGRHVATVTAIEDLGEGDVVSLTTSSKTLIADGFLGHNSTIFFNECSQIGYSSVLLAWTRLAKLVPGLTNRAFYDLNPTLMGHWTARLFKQHIDPLSKERSPILDPNEYVWDQLNPEDNAANIDPKVLQQLRNLPLAQRKRFYEGEYSAEQAGQLWSWDILQQHRMPPILPEEVERYGIRRIVIAVDPSGASGESDMKADEIGITVQALDERQKGYLLEDASGLYSPERWGSIVNNLYEKWNADLIVGEKNFGGDMVRAVIQAKNKHLPYKAVNASRSKAQRAEPIAAYYEQGMVAHCGEFPILEDELTNFTTSGYIGESSPNHADAVIWGFTELFEGHVGTAWIDTMKTLALGLEDKSMELSSKGLIVKMDDGKPMTQEIEKVSTSAMIKPALPANADECPKCGSKALARIGTMKRCGQCGEQIGRTGVDVSVNAMLPGQRTRMLK